jgi:hypothetical protein
MKLNDGKKLTRKQNKAKNKMLDSHRPMFSVFLLRDFNISRNAEKLHEHLKNRNSSHTAGTPKKEWILIKVETPGTEGMSARAGPQNQQNATLQHEC